MFYVIPLYFCAIVAFILIYFAWRNRNLANPAQFSLIMLALAEWSIAYALIINSPGMAPKIFWVKVGYVGTSIVPVAWLIFILQYSQRQMYLNRRNLIILSIVPLITILLAWTNEAHHLVWASVTLDDTGRFPIFENGAWFWFFVSYSYLLLLLGTILLIRTLNKLLWPDSGQFVAILFGALLPWVGNILYVSGFNPVAPMDLTPFTFILASIALYWGFHRFSLLKVLPLIRSTLFDNLPDGVLVLNAQDFVVTVNPVAQKLLGEGVEGRPLSQVFPAAAKPLAQFQNSVSGQMIICVDDNGEQRFYDWRMSTMYGDLERVNGRVITLRDITEEQQDKARLQALHKKSAAQAEVLRQREYYLQILNDITQTAASALDLKELLETLADKMIQLIQADACHIALWDETDQLTKPGAASGVYKNTYQNIRPDPGEATLTQSALNMGRTLPIEDTFNTPYISQRLANMFPDVKSALALPFIASGQKLGSALLLFNHHRRFPADEIDRMEQAAAQIALAVAKIKFNEATKRQIEELAALNDIAVVSTEAINVDELISYTTDIFKTRFYPDNFGIYLLDEKTNSLRPHQSYHQQIHIEPLPMIPLNQGIVGKVATTGQPLRIGDVSQHPDYWQIIPETRSQLCVPLRADDEIIGVINTESNSYDSYTIQDEQFLVTIAGQLATAVKKILLFNSEQLRRKEAETLREATAVLTTTLNLDHLLNLILRQLENVLAYDSATIFMFQGEFARIMACRGLPDNENQIGKCYPAKNNLLTEILIKKRPIFLGNAHEEPAFMRWSGTIYVKGWLGVPLIVRNQVIGYLTIDSRQANSYGPNEAESALAFANQAALAIENARLYAKEQEQRQVAETLRAANIALTQELDFQTVLETLLDFLGRLVPFDSASVMWVQENGQTTILALRGYEQWTDTNVVQNIAFDCSKNWSFKTLYDTHQGLLVTNTELESRWHTLPETAYIKSWLGMPMTVGNKVIGFFSVDKATPNFFTEHHLQLTEQLASQTAVALQNAILYQDTQRRAEEMETINNVSAALRQVQLVDDILITILKTAVNVISGVHGKVALVDPPTGSIVARGVYPSTEPFTEYRYPPGPSISQYVVDTGEIYITENLSTDPLAYRGPEGINAPDPNRTCISLPLHVQDRIIGVMHISRDMKRPYTANEIQILSTIAEIAGSALDRALILETLEERITQRTHDLSVANEQLQELDRLKTKFISDVSHELRTPITNINLYIDLFKQGAPERRPHYIDVIRKESDRLTKLMEDTLSISRLDTGSTKLEKTDINLNEIITTITAQFRSRAELADLKLIIDLQPDLPVIQGNAKQISQIVTQLMTNAINYTTAGSIEVTSFETTNGDSICLQIKDTGSGIDDEDQKHLFERFYRGKNTGQSNIPGTGLGLAIVKEIVMLHDGQIELDSKPGQGSTFRIILPRTMP